MDSRITPSELRAVLRRDTGGWRTARPVALLLAMVIAVGASLGAAAYRVTSADRSMPVKLTRTARGWRVASPDGLVSQSLMALSDTHLAWSDGGALELLDLRSGAVKELAEAPASEGEGWGEVVMSERYVVWLDNGLDGHTTVRVYELATRRSSTLSGATRLDGIGLGGDTLYWTSDRSTATHPDDEQLWACDLTDGHRSVIAQGPVLLAGASGSLVMWTLSLGKSARDQVTVVRDMATGRTWRLRLCPKGCQVDQTVLSGRSVVWQVERDLSGGGFVNGAIDVLDLDSGTRRAVTTGKDPWFVGAGGGHVVWQAKGGTTFMEDVEGRNVVALREAREMSGSLLLSEHTIAFDGGQTNGGSAWVQVSRIVP